MLVVAFVNSRTEVAATAEKRNGQRKAYTNMPIVIRPKKIAGELKAHRINDRRTHTPLSTVQTSPPQLLDAAGVRYN